MDTLEAIEIETGDAPQAAVIWLHGLGADANDFVPVVPELRLDAREVGAVRFVFPNAPMIPVTINGGYVMRAWYDIVGTDLTRREDQAGLQRSRLAIDALVEREMRRGIDSSRIVLAGFSQGCAVTLLTGLRQPHRLAGLIGLSGYLPQADRTAAERHPASFGVPIFLAHGQFDDVVLPSRGEAARDQLLALDCDVSWHTYPMPHSVCDEEIHDIGQFLGRVLRQR